MPRRRTTSRTRHQHPRTHILSARVTSPRIRIVAAKRFLRNLIVITFCLGILGYIGLNIYSAFQKFVVHNPDYTITEIALKTNGGLDRDWLRSKLAIDSSTTLYSLNLTNSKATLQASPEIISAKLKRSLPNTLEVELVERTPIAWLSSASTNHFANDHENGLLLDENGNLFRCEGELARLAESLPVIHLPQHCKFLDDLPEFNAGHCLSHPTILAALRLSKQFQQIDEDAALPRLARISPDQDFSLLAEFADGTEAIFGYFEHSRQVTDFIRIWEHYDQSKRKIAQVNLIPTRNIPVTFRQDAPRRALIVVEPELH